MNHIIAVAKATKNVLSSTDPNDFIFHSQYNTFKILAEGLLTNQNITGNPTTLTVAHGRPSIPCVYALAKFPDGYVALPAESDHAFTVGGGRYWLCEVDATNINLKFYRVLSSFYVSGLEHTVVNDASHGTLDWTNISSIQTDDNVYSTCTFAGGASSKYLKLTNFQFNIPTGATILSIRMRKEGYYTGDLVGTSRARLVKGGSVQGDTWDGNFLTTESILTRENGGADLWGLTWTPADINASDFGLVLYSDIDSGNGTVFMDWADLRIKYEFDGGTYAVSVKYYIFETPV